MTKLDVSLFSSIVANTPLISIDLIVKNSRDKVLLGKRTNRPAKDSWFVPGGRVLKNETISDAFTRLVLDELGLNVSINEGQFIGVYEHFYPDNFSGKEFSTHYVVLGYQLFTDFSLALLPKEQHDNYRWWDTEELLISDEVHLHSKWYFDSVVGIRA